MDLPVAGSGDETEEEVVRARVRNARPARRPQDARRRSGTGPRAPGVRGILRIGSEHLRVVYVVEADVRAYSWRTVIACPPGTITSNQSSTVSFPSCRRPSATIWSTTTATNVFVTLPTRKRSPARIGRPRAPRRPRSRSLPAEPTSPDEEQHAGAPALERRSTIACTFVVALRHCSRASQPDEHGASQGTARTSEHDGAGRAPPSRDDVEEHAMLARCLVADLAAGRRRPRCPGLAVSSSRAWISASTCPHLAALHVADDADGVVDHVVLRAPWPPPISSAAFPTARARWRVTMPSRVAPTSFTTCANGSRRALGVASCARIQRQAEPSADPYSRPARRPPRLRPRGRRVREPRVGVEHELRKSSGPCPWIVATASSTLERVADGMAELLVHVGEEARPRVPHDNRGRPSARRGCARPRAPLRTAPSPGLDAEHDQGRLRLDLLT